MDSARPAVHLREIFATFFMIGLTGFGGGMAIISLMERRCVEEKKWIPLDEFMHGVAFGQILGPFSLNTCTFVGYYLRGIRGGVAASTGFIAPSFILVSLLSLLYFRFHRLPALESALKGTNPVVIALILVAAVGMARAKVRRKGDVAIALASFCAAAFLGVGGVPILLVAFAWSILRSWYEREHE